MQVHNNQKHHLSQVWPMACSQAAVGPPLDRCSCSAGGGGASAALRSRRGGSGDARSSAAVMKTVRSCLRTRPYCGGQSVWFSLDRSGNVLEARSWDADWLPGTLHNQSQAGVLFLCLMKVHQVKLVSILSATECFLSSL